MNTVVERLSRKVGDSESQQIREQTLILESLREKTESLSSQQWEEGFSRLAPYRLTSSGTLKKGDVESWQQANLYAAQKIQAEQDPAWNDILNLNALLLKAPQAEIRTTSIYLGPREACPPHLLAETLGYFSEHILPSQKHANALLAAALCQYWLVSLHPFMDANGRTAVLLADWILGRNGYLPMSFATKLDAIVATLEDDRASATAANAILKLLKNVQRSYRLILGEEI
ncbi:Fic family protein [Bdellovibrio bacteriovorus]|uniref:Fic family protein n=1 Tax=Bdellovibrio bacteriovorus TaxID=959 RepID=UPI0035A582D1